MGLRAELFGPFVERRGFGKVVKPVEIICFGDQALDAVGLEMAEFG